MSQAERAVVIEGAVGGVVLSVIAFVLSRFMFACVSFDWSSRPASS
jgi:hypothetical protein